MTGKGGVRYYGVTVTIHEMLSGDHATELDELLNVFHSQHTVYSVL